MSLVISDFPQAHGNGLGLSFNWVTWQMIRHPGRKYYVNLDKPSNPFHEPSRGPNPWDFYFQQEPPDAEMEAAPVEDPLDLPLSGHRDWTLERQRVISTFARKHIRLRPEIQAEVDSFRRQHFLGKVLAIHVRGSDKISEYQPMRADRLVGHVNALRERLRPDTLFLMTDDVFYHNLFGPMHPVSLTIPRGALSLHHNPPRGPYMSGLWAVLDGWLAASATWFAYTPSNMATIPLIIGQHEEIIRLNAHCVIEPFCVRVDKILGIPCSSPS